MHKKLWFFLFPLTLLAFNENPWVEELWEIYFNPSYRYQTYSNIQNGNKPSKKYFKNQVLNLDFSILFLPQWEFKPLVELSGVSLDLIKFRSLGFQIRYLCLNDILEDNLSLMSGISFRHVFSKSLKNPTCPYHQRDNLEFQIILGKEWSESFDWKSRFYILKAIGIANKGSPWIRLKAAVEKNMQDIHQVGFLIEGYKGFGHHQFVNIKDFKGYAFIDHSNIDAGIYYTYIFPIFGQISIFYSYRLYAKCFPNKMHTFLIQYKFPFSCF